MTGEKARCIATFPSASERPFVLVANPASRRVELFQAALKRLGIRLAKVIAFADVLEDGEMLAREMPEGALVKVDSPGKEFMVEKAILAMGAGGEGGRMFSHVSAECIRGIAFRRGEILYPGQWYRGFSRLVTRMGSDLQRAASHQLMNDLESIMLMFDKPGCHAFLKNNGIPVARTPGPAGTIVRSHAELLEWIAAARMPRVFVKLAYGSSASGVVAFQMQGSRQRATTTVEMVREAGELRLFNSRRIRTYTDAGEVKCLIDALCGHRVHVEEWIPKAGISGKTFDLRIVGIGGEPRYVVGRLSRHPITNLHLLNERCDAEPIRRRMGDARWEALRETCRRVMALFPRCLYVAMDVVIRADWRGHVVIELNAFGDLLQGIMDGGEDIYTAEIRAGLAAEVAA